VFKQLKGFCALLLLQLCAGAVIIANERRSESVQSAFTGLFSQAFTFKKVPLAKQDADFCHPAIELYILKKKKGASDASLAALEAQEAAESGEAAAEAAAQAQLAATSSGLQRLVVQEQRQELEKEQQPHSQQQPDHQQQQQHKQIQRHHEHPQQQQQPEPAGEQLSGSPPACVSQHEQPAVSSAAPDQRQQGRQVSWQTRRAGVEAARLLAGAVQVPQAVGPVAAAVKQ
jgi:hypothetical protein